MNANWPQAFDIVGEGDQIGGPNRRQPEPVAVSLKRYWTESLRNSSPSRAEKSPLFWICCTCHDTSGQKAEVSRRFDTLYCGNHANHWRGRGCRVSVSPDSDSLRLDLERSSSARMNLGSRIQIEVHY